MIETKKLPPCKNKTDNIFHLTLKRIVGLIMEVILIFFITILMLVFNTVHLPKNQGDELFKI